MGQQRVRVLSLCVAFASVACSSEQRVLGERCPNPYVRNSGATLAADAGPSALYGTSCAPCTGDEPRLDAIGCPVYVTFESCGGDVCFGDVRVTPSGGDEDGGTDDDGGVSEEDGGAD
jgi:hypothetical protein